MSITLAMPRATSSTSSVSRSSLRNAETFLYNTGPVTALNDPDLNFRQTYSVTRVTQYGDNAAPQSQIIGANLPVPPVNIGPKSTPNYPALASQAIKTIGTNDSINVFAGPRDDSFFVDLGSVFDLLTLRPQPAPVGYASGSPRTGVDGLAGYNVHTIALQVADFAVARTEQQRSRHRRLVQR